MPSLTLAFFIRLRCWLGLTLCLLLIACQAAQTPAAPQAITAQHWLMDKTSQATLADIQAATDWQPLPDWKSWGYGPETVWVRLRLNTASQTQTPWVIQVKPPLLDYVSLYDPTHGLVQHSGDALPPHDKELASINLTFQVPATPSERWVYLKVRSISARTFQVSAMPMNEALQKNRQQEWLIGFVVATSAVFAIWALSQWLFTRDPVMGAYAIKQIMATAWGFLMLGFARVSVGDWFPEGRLSDITSICFMWVVGVTLWFLSTLISHYRPSPFALRGLRTLAAFLAVLPIWYGTGDAYLALMVGNFCIPLGACLLVITFLTAPRHQAQQPISWPLMLLYLGCYSLFHSLPPLMHLGWIEVNRGVILVALAHTVVDGVLMFVMLQMRANALQKQHLQSVVALQRSQEKAEAEARHREEQSQLFAMLAHEMRTPLATLRMRMAAGPAGKEAMERTINDMSQIIERCVHSSQLAEQGLQPRWQVLDALALTREACAQSRMPDQVDLFITAEAAPLESDAQMLSIVLSNLMDNACKYGAAQTRILVQLEAAMHEGRAGWRWCVRNEVGSAGLPDAAQLFDKYYRSPHAHRQSGSGLGLFLVKGLLHLLHGRIDYQAEGNCAAFSVWIPAHPEARW
jgi:signal transduction histidine kinase